MLSLRHLLFNLAFSYLLQFPKEKTKKKQQWAKAEVRDPALARLLLRESDTLSGSAVPATSHSTAPRAETAHTSALCPVSATSLDV